MKLQCPIKKYSNEPIYITLVYGDKSYVEAYKKLGWSLTHHNGVDLVNSANNKRAYGTPVLASHDGKVIKVVWDSPMSTKGNGVFIESEPFDSKDGKKRILSTVYWHLSAVKVKAGDKVKAGQMVGRLGNSGFVIGSTLNPQKGTHIHFGLYVYVFNNGKWEVEFLNNGVKGAVDPLDWMEENWQEKAQRMNWLDILEYFTDIKNLIEAFKGR